MVEEEDWVESRGGILLGMFGSMEYSLIWLGSVKGIKGGIGIMVEKVV